MKNKEGLRSEHLPAQLIRFPHQHTLKNISRRQLISVFGTLASAPCLTFATAAQPATGFYSNFAGLRLIDQDGLPIDPTRWLGQTVLVHFIFTGCSTTCPIQMRALAEMQRQLPTQVNRRVQLFSISIDPLHDSPSTLKAFGRRMSVDFTNWSFGTGRVTDIEKLSVALRLFRPQDQARKPDDHSTALWVVDAKGQLRMRYAGNPPDVPRLVREISVLAAA